MRSLANALSRQSERLSFALFLLGLAVVLFVAGIVVGHFKLPPTGVLNAAWDAAVALKERYWIAEEPLAFPTSRTQGGVVTWDHQRASPGFTLLAGYRDGRFGARLVDMEGRVVHTWDVAFSQVWPKAVAHVQNRAPDNLVYWQGVHLFPDGDLLLNFQGGNFPLGGGLVRIDRNSTLKWALERNTHHDMDVLADGTVVVSAHAYRTDGIPACERLLNPPYYEDQILLVSPDGQVREEISILGALCRSSFKSLFSVTGKESGSWRGQIESDDPLHLNNVDVVGPGLARVLPMAQDGDLFLSLRNLNTIGFLDRDTGLFRWLLTGPFIRQHDPDLLSDGSILVFDNLGGGTEVEHSRVLVLDPVTQAILWSYEGVGQDALWSKKMGNQQPLPNGNVLITESWGGRVLEVTRSSKPEVVWEYVNLLPSENGEARIGLISQAWRFAPGELAFLGALAGLADAREEPERPAWRGETRSSSMAETR